MSDTQMCYKCEPPREIGPGQIEGHNKDVHDGGKHKVPHPAKPVGLTPQQQQELADAAAKALANLSAILPPLASAFQAWAQSAMPVMVKAFEPLKKWVDNNQEVVENLLASMEEDRYE